jgi:hypothetical protein
MLYKESAANESDYDRRLSKPAPNPHRTGVLKGDSCGSERLFM